MSNAGIRKTESLNNLCHIYNIIFRLYRPDM
jgi:hypothetical protein